MQIRNHIRPTYVDTPVVILYGGGSYGSFIEWCLLYFGDMIDTVELPFLENGSSHKFRGNSLPSFKQWQTYKNSIDYHTLPILRSHISDSAKDKTENDSNLLYQIISDSKKVIWLHPTERSIAWSINNKFTKIGNNWLLDNQDLFAGSLSGWGVSNIAQLKPWELRDFLSVYILDQHLFENNLSLLDNFSSDNILKVPIENIRDEFASTITNIMTFCEFEIKRNNFDEIFDAWVSLQKFCYQDLLIEKIVKCVIENNFYDYYDQKLTITDEALIQMKLRDLYNLDLKCYNLDVFPTNTNDLKNLLIPK